MTPAQQKQYADISVLRCPTREGDSYVRHGLIRVSTRQLRDWFRLRVWWRCHFCDFSEEQVGTDVVLPGHIWGAMNGVCVKCGQAALDRSPRKHPPPFHECWGSQK